MDVRFVAVETAEDQEKLAKLADEVWHEYWPPIIGKAQADYMVDKFQSVDAISFDMAEHGYEYWFVVDENDKVVGFTGGREEWETNRYFISKIYLVAGERGKHYASKIIGFYTDLCHERGFRAMYLTVNKHNELGLRAYKGKGFTIIESVVNDIGGGFVMDDYIMQKDV